MNMVIKSKVKNTKPSDVIEHLSNNFRLIKNDHVDVYSRELCSALVYRYILKRHGIDMSVEQILRDEPYIGLLGQRDEFEMFHTISFLRLHGILHDSYGRLYTRFKLDRGYCYALNKAPKCLKKSPFFGHITGFWFCLKHKFW